MEAKTDKLVKDREKKYTRDRKKKHTFFAAIPPWILMTLEGEIHDMEKRLVGVVVVSE